MVWKSFHGGEKKVSSRIENDKWAFITPASPQCEPSRCRERSKHRVFSHIFSSKPLIMAACVFHTRHENYKNQSSASVLQARFQKVGTQCQTECDNLWTHFDTCSICKHQIFSGFPSNWHKGSSAPKTPVFTHRSTGGQLHCLWREHQHFVRHGCGFVVITSRRCLVWIPIGSRAFLFVPYSGPIRSISGLYCILYLMGPDIAQVIQQQRYGRKWVK